MEYYKLKFWTMPDGEPVWLEVPAGEFWMGSEKGESDAKPVHKVYLPHYAIAKAPITNVQYQLFAKACQYAPPEHWKDGKISYDKENHPVVNVSWHDAIAYCQWLSNRTGKRITLPSEAEWEKAARGTTEQFEYPWGYSWKKGLCNTGKKLSEQNTTSVGIFTAGASPYGCVDMAGNVWEWTRSIYKPYPYQKDDGREDLETTEEGFRVVRGGSFANHHRYSRCIYRSRRTPNLNSSRVGFRVVISPLSDGSIGTELGSIHDEEEIIEPEILQESVAPNRNIEHIKQCGITLLYHMTNIANLNSILIHGLLSHNEAHKRGLVSADISDPSVQNRRSGKPIYNRSLHDYVCLYFSPRNPMLYCRSDQQHEIILLGIDPIVLLDDHTIFSDGNAASGPTCFYQDTAQLAQLPWSIINADYWPNFVDGKRIKCAEVLVYPRISVQYIRQIFCYNSKQYSFCQQLTSGKIPVEVKPSFYF